LEEDAAGSVAEQTIPLKTQERGLKFSAIQYQGSTPASSYICHSKRCYIQQIKKTYKGGTDIGKSLEEDMNKVDLTTEAPTRAIATAADHEEKLVEQAGLVQQ
jgi:hypothetical protein